jgi:hypothetical protein
MPSDVYIAPIVAFQPTELIADDNPPDGKW